MSSLAKRVETDRRLREAGEWLLVLEDKSVPDARVAEWIRWCEHDPENLAAFERAQSLWSDIGRATPPMLPSARRSFFAMPVGFRVAAFASVAALAIAVASWIWLGAGRSQAPIVGTPATVTATLLPDGSALEVGAQTLVGVDYGKERRLEMRDGEAYFNVAHDKTRPFVVEAGPLEVRAVGTAFDIRRNAERVSVSVIEGKVEIAVLTPAHAPAEARRIILAAGHEFRWESKSAQTRIAQIDPAAAAAWRAGRLEYVKESLKVVVADTNRYSPRPIELADAAARDLEFTGTVFTRSIDDWLDALPHAFPLEREDLPDRIVLKSRH